MADNFTDVVDRGFGSNMMDSFKSVVVGIVLFLVSFPILWWNEGRVDLSTVAKKATVVSADAPSKDADGKLVAVTGALTPEGTLGDPQFLKPGAYVSLRRDVEMYAWVEEKETRTEKKIGGGSQETTTYHYVLKWTDDPKPASAFKHPEEHVNPTLPIKDYSARVDRAKIGAFAFTAHDIELPHHGDLDLTSDKLVGRPALGARLVGDLLFAGKGTPESPKLGDVRIKFSVVEAGRKVTAYGKQEGAQLTPFLYDGKDTFFRALDGTHEQAIAYLHQEHTIITWILRIVGFFCMWWGMALVMSPMNAFLDIIPFFGSAGRFITSVIMFPIALVFSSITIVASMIAHSPVMLGLVMLATVGTGVVLYRRAKQKKLAQTGRVAA